MLDLTKQENKKYIPIGTFVLGVIVGAALMHYWVQKKGKSDKFESGGSVAPAPTTIQVIAPAPVAPTAPVSVAPAPAMGAGGSEVFSTPSM
jgi:hypothetical protein